MTIPNTRSLDLGSLVTLHMPPRYNFRFARVFGPQATQRQVFDVVAKEGPAEKGTRWCLASKR